MGALEGLQPGDPQRIGPYRLVARLGAGGMGRVYLGYSRGGRRAVAVKVVRPELGDDQAFLDRFAREVALARTVSGFFTAAVLDAEPKGNPPWLATAYVPGMSLDDAVSAHGPWPENSVLALGVGLGEALQSIHSVGVVHRDLKPSNVLLTADGPRVIDFGISVAIEGTRLTQTGMAVGTPGFVSPEQLTGDPVGPASDVFSLGAVLTFTASGSGPFGAGSWQGLWYRTVHQDPDLQALPPGLRGLVERCLAKRPEARPTTTELIDELTGAAWPDGRPAPATQFTGVSWLPEAVAQIVRGRAMTPVADRPDARTEHVQRPGPPPTPTRALIVPPPAGGGDRRGPTRRRVLLGLSAAGALAAGVAGTRFLASPPPSQRAEKWKLAGAGSPVVANGLLYTDVRSTLYALDPATGRERWSFRLRSRVNSMVTDGRTVYFSDLRKPQRLYAVSGATGRELWHFDCEAISKASPVQVQDGVVYTRDLRHLYAVSADTGRQMWRFGYVSSDEPVLTRRAIYLLDYEEQVCGLHPISGDVLTKFTIPDQRPSPLELAEGTLYLRGDGRLYAVDAQSGEVKWQIITTGAPSRPVVSGEVVCFAADSGRFCGVDGASGKELWHVDTGGNLYSQPVVEHGVAYFGGRDGVLHAVEAASGDERWTFSVRGTGMRTPVLARGTVYVASDHLYWLYAVDAVTGSARWRLRTDGEIHERVVTDKMVYVASRSLYAAPV
ncbi:PQQ-binding-like beta-propeller repeat protein [Nonomuraea sp. NPDC048826]|uniref:outer membrane protein assembly factor BamB family protein n=1 Tax=Nonomuraea sp. NPDC048826 TaxID=3364347 RepID=UPI0037159AE3